MNKREFETIHILFYKHGYTISDIAELLYRTETIINAILSVKEFSELTDFDVMRFWLWMK